MGADRSMAAETAAGPDGRSTYRTFEPAGSSSQRPHRAIVSRERAEHVPAERSPDLPPTAAIAIHRATSLAGLASWAG